MTELNLISPMLDDFEVGGVISDHDGVRCYPAMRKNSDEKYIVKVISVPASQTKLDALLLTGAYSSKEAALAYFEALANEIADEKRILDDLAQLEGFVTYTDIQVVPKDDANGFDVYLLGEYRMTLERQIAKTPLTQLGAVNLGLDLCSALSVCRHSGFLCVDIKPANIVLTGDKEFRIGDLGFVKLSSLQYASLPDKYRSAYTAPEVEDAFSTLNDTIDIYAVGLVLYQVFNGGKLPFDGTITQKEQLPPPLYADEEMSEIIMKACAFDPAERWQDPAEMGQALVSYMQKNGVNDTPIDTEVFGLKEEAEADSECAEQVSDEETLQPDANEVPVVEVQEMQDQVDEAVEEDAVLAPEDDDNAKITIEASEPESVDEVVSFVDEITAAINTSETIDIPEELNEETDVDIDGNLHDDTFIIEDSDADLKADAEQLVIYEMSDDFSLEEAASEEIDVDYNGISEEVSEILNQVDELAAHQIPDPPVAPEPVEIILPEPEQVVNETVDVAESEEASQEAVNESAQEEVSPEEIKADEMPYIPKKKRTGLKWCIALLLIIGLAIGTYFFYTDYYLQPIHTLNLIGSEDRLHVQLSADIDETYLTVVCSDSHGSKIPAPVVGGTAVFSGLMPDTTYTVTVEVDGLHKLTGMTSKVYSTPVQTKIAQISVVTGAEDGSVILSFAVEGPDSDQWNVIYSAEGEAERVTAFPSHMVTLTGLTVGKEYTFRLEAADDIYLSNVAEVTYVAREVVYAENLHVTGCADGILSAQWDAPSSASVSQWSVRCYNENGYNETVLTEETEVVFENIDDTCGYTIDVTAADMSVSRQVTVGSNSITVTDFIIEASNSEFIQLSWSTNRDSDGGEWTLLYTVDGINAVNPVKTSKNTAQVPVVPGGEYVFTLLDSAGNPVLGGPFVHVQDVAADFDAYSVTKDDLTIRLCKTPESSAWSYKDLDDDDYVNTFVVGQKVSAVIALSGSFEKSDNDILITYVVRGENKELITFAHDVQTWRSMWYQNYCELDVQGIPTELGTFELTIFFNGQTVGTQKFEIAA